MTRRIASGHDRRYEREQRQRGQTAAAAPERPDGRRSVRVNLVRLGFGVFTVFYGLGFLVYLAAWAILPREGEDSSILESFVKRF
jgi:hypothetical protein